MRNHFRGIALAFAIAINFSWTAAAQTKQPSVPPAAASPFDPHDLSGVWMQDRPRMSTVLERYWIYELTLEEPPMTAWGQAQFKAAKSSFGTHAYPIAETNDPIYHTLFSHRISARLFSCVSSTDRANARRSHHAF